MPQGQTEVMRIWMKNRNSGDFKKISQHFGTLTQNELSTVYHKRERKTTTSPPQCGSFHVRYAFGLSSACCERVFLCVTSFPFDEFEEQ